MPIQLAMESKFRFWQMSLVLTCALSVTILAAPAVTALDLSNFQSFLRQSSPSPQKVRQDRSYSEAQTQSLSDAGNGNVRGGSEYADASYQQPHHLINLGTKPSGGERFSLPPETRVPEGLRPLLTDWKYPRQGVGWSGSTGSLLTPSPGVLEPGKSAFAVHASAFDLYNVNDVKFDDQQYFDTSIKFVFGVMEGLEMGVDKTFQNQDRFSIEEPLYVNVKYQVPGNITLGGSFCTENQAGYHTVWVGAGVPVAWVAVGSNWGAGNYRFSYNGWDQLKRSKYGGYNYRYDRGEGFADPVYFMLGGTVPLGEAAHFVYDFNGDRFSLGFRLNYRRALHFDAGYVSDGDYERLPGAIAHKKKSNFIFGGSVVY